MTWNQASEHEKLDDFRVLTKTLDAFRTFETKSLKNLVEIRRENLKNMKNDPFLDKYIKKYHLFDHLNQIEERIHINQKFLDYVFQIGKLNWADTRDESQYDTPWSSGNAVDFSKVQSTLRQLVREWSEEGERERHDSYGPIFEELDNLFPDVQIRHKIRILVPGCGLARLPFELARRGFQTQGNEFSYFMLITSNIMLNHTIGLKGLFKIHPYIYSFSHLQSWEEQLQEISIPDVDPHVLLSDMQNNSAIPDEGLLSMSAGSFDEIYGQKFDDIFDVITTVFFIDTSPHLPKTIKAIADSLNSGGYWINFGPLLWHFENDDELAGFELPMNTIIEDLIPSMGFEIIKHTTNHKCRYTSRPSPASGFTYNCDFWLARKL